MSDAAGHPVLIDLGEVGRAADPVPVAAPGPRRPRRVRGRWPVALAVVVAALAILTTAGPVTRLEPAFTLRVNAWAVALDAVNAYVSTGSGAAATVTAYRLADGRPAWQRPLYGQGVVDVSAVPGSAAIVTGRCPDLADALTTVVDPETGRHRWLFAGVPIGAGADGRTVLMLTADGSCRSERYDRPPVVPATVSGVSVATGRPLWKVRLDGSDRLAAAAGPAGIDDLLVVHRDGRVVGYHSGTGSVTATAQLSQLARASTGPWRTLGTLPDPAGPPPPQVNLVGTHLLLSEVDGSTAWLQAYPVDGGSRQWLRTVVRAPGADPSGFRLAGCPPWLCLLDGAQVVAMAPETGSTIWRRELAQAQVEAGRLLGYDPAGGGGLRLVDSRSGFDVLDLDGWQRVPTLAARPAPVLVARPYAGATTFATLDPGSGTLRVLGTAGGAVDRCAHAALRLVCTDRAGAVRAWQTRE